VVVPGLRGLVVPGLRAPSYFDLSLFVLSSLFVRHFNSEIDDPSLYDVTLNTGRSCPNATVIPGSSLDKQFGADVIA
jgi:hypothetical protein